MSASRAGHSIHGFRHLAEPLRVRVLIRPKEGILDPQGQAVERALPALGYEKVANVHVGRLVELDVGGDERTVTARVEEMCEALLANPLIESYEVQAVAS
jgi:phosphoribosylformylglycinamidine synthase subunit PurS